LPTLATAVLRHLREVLGIEVPGMKPWARANQLPYFLRDAFQFSELELLGQPIVLALAVRLRPWPGSGRSMSLMHWPPMTVDA
jgi:hypothetical protein